MNNVLHRQRSPKQGASRIYTLTYRRLDLAGNAVTCSVTVAVPHDRRGDDEWGDHPRK